MYDVLVGFFFQEGGDAFYRRFKLMLPPVKGVQIQTDMEDRITLEVTEVREYPAHGIVRAMCAEVYDIEQHRINNSDEEYDALVSKFRNDKRWIYAGTTNEASAYHVDFVDDMKRIFDLQKDG